MTKRSLFSQFRTSLISMLLVLLLTIVGCYWMVISHWSQQTQAKVDTALKETADQLMRDIRRPDGLYGVVFDKPWQDIFSYVNAIRQQKPFGLRADESRRHTPIQPLERPYEYLDVHDQPG